MSTEAADHLVPGLCSVTLRASAAEEIISLAVDAGLRTIEWGGDVHVPVGDLRRAAAVRRKTEDAGLAVCSYGSYFGQDDQPTDFDAVLDTAQALGAQRIRIWAGSLASAVTSAEHRARLVSAVQDAAARAAAAQTQVAFEFHPNTLTDTVDSTLCLLAEVDRPNVATYWQPPIDISDEAAVAGLHRVLDHVVTVHAFSWWPGDHRLPLDSRAELWRRVAAELAGVSRALPVLLEFVPDDAPEAIRPEAAALRVLLGIDDRSYSQ